jgi:two-component system, NarL family, sensor histidine kinase DegS
MERPATTNQSSMDEFQQEIQNELDLFRRSLKEVSMMIEQSQAEMAKLNQRNTAINGHLQQILGQFDTTPRPDIRNAFTAALDIQQRVLVMRGQLDKLQSDQTNLQRSVQMLEKIQKMFADGILKRKTGRLSGSGMATLEMVINAQESVRQRLSQQMHDGPAQALSNFILQTDIAMRMFDMDPEKAKEELNNMRVAAMGAFQKVRGFITELRPMMLDDLGLFPTLRRYVDVYKEQSGQDISLVIKGQERRLAPYLEVMIFRAVQELMGNAVRHNQDHPMRLQIQVQMVIDESLIRISVSDTGKGFDPEVIGKKEGLGLKLIRERVEILGGTMEIDSAPGKGAKVGFQVPNLEAGKSNALK